MYDLHGSVGLVVGCAADDYYVHRRRDEFVGRGEADVVEYLAADAAQIFDQLGRHLHRLAVGPWTLPKLACRK